MLENFLYKDLNVESVLDIMVSTDTRHLKTGDIFVALNGPNFTGDHFISIAAEHGARAAIVHTINPDVSIPQLVVEDTLVTLTDIARLKRQATSAKVIAITGSAGKTSVKGMLHAICDAYVKNNGKNIAHSVVVSTQGNLNNHIGVPLTILSITRDTRILIVEAGTSGVGEIAHLAHIIQPHIAVINNIAEAHVENFGSIDAIAKEKSALYTQSDLSCLCVINLDDYYANYFQQHIDNRQVIGYSLVNDHQHTDVTVEDVHINTAGFPEFTLCTSSEKKHMALNVVGEHNVSNALAASSCAIALDIDVKNIALGLKQYKGIAGRMNVHHLGKYVVIDDTYNANPKSMFAAIDYLSSQPNSILILGDMGELGEFASNAHMDVGAYALQKNIQQFYCVGKFIHDYVKGFGIDAHSFVSQHHLLSFLNTQQLSGAVVLIKGSRSAKMENIVSFLIAAAECQ